MQGKELKRQLESLAREASSVDPRLEKRLNEINRWIKAIKPGSLIAKRFVLGFLLQIIKDSRAWLDIRALSSPEERQAYFDRQTPTERYWYSYLFPKWLSENDPKFSTWRQKLMAGEFRQEDEVLIKSLAENIERSEGTVVHRYIADLSMATDIIVSSRLKKPLCIQLTTLSDEYSQEKYENWMNVLKTWEIDRGLFLSYNPGEVDFMNQLVNLALDNSDNLSQGIYLKFP